VVVVLLLVVLLLLLLVLVALLLLVVVVVVVPVHWVALKEGIRATLGRELQAIATQAAAGAAPSKGMVASWSPGITTAVVVAAARGRTPRLSRTRATTSPRVLPQTSLQQASMAAPPWDGPLA